MLTLLNKLNHLGSGVNLSGLLNGGFCCCSVTVKEYSLFLSSSHSRERPEADFRMMDTETPRQDQFKSHFNQPLEGRENYVKYLIEHSNRVLPCVHFMPEQLDKLAAMPQIFTQRSVREAGPPAPNSSFLAFPKLCCNR